jgi:hypothetical protein
MDKFILKNICIEVSPYVCVPCDKEMQKGTDIMHSYRAALLACTLAGSLVKKTACQGFCWFWDFLGPFFDESSFVLNQLVIGKNPQANSWEKIFKIKK